MNPAEQIGHSKAKCEVKLKVKVCEVPVAFAKITPSVEVKGSRRLEFTLVAGGSCTRLDSQRCGHSLPLIQPVAFMAAALSTGHP